MVERWSHPMYYNSLYCNNDRQARLEPCARSVRRRLRPVVSTDMVQDQHQCLSEIRSSTGSGPFAKNTLGAGRAGDRRQNVLEAPKSARGDEAPRSHRGAGAPRMPPTSRRRTFCRLAELGVRSKWPRAGALREFPKGIGTSTAMCRARGRCCQTGRASISVA